jgi:hypothetical protein
MAPATLILPAGEAQRAGSNGRPASTRNWAFNGPALSVALTGLGRAPGDWRQQHRRRARPGVFIPVAKLDLNL